MAMSEGRDVFRAGIAIAPPTSWRYYDTIYTERFMRTPQQNAEGYRKSSVLSRAKNLKGQLLIVTGTADDNVHPQNTYEVAEAFVQNDLDFDMMVYTNRNHFILGGNSNVHIYKKVCSYFKRNL